MSPDAHTFDFLIVIVFYATLLDLNKCMGMVTLIRSQMPDRHDPFFCAQKGCGMHAALARGKGDPVGFCFAKCHFTIWLHAACISL